MSETPHFDRLSAALFDGEHKVVDIVVVEGTEPSTLREHLARALYASMERIGLIVDGQLRPPQAAAAR